MNLKQNHSLKNDNTFGIDIKALYFIEIHQLEELISLLQSPQYKEMRKLILGGGSNILFTGDFEGLVIKICLKGIEIIKQDAQHIYLKVQAGEVWHELIIYCLEHNYAGIENLSLIPGNVGAAPMQNIGAYGVELKEVFEGLEAVRMEDGNLKKFTPAQCHFGYRDSIFKNELKGQYVITSIILRLNKKPVFNTSYGAVQKILKEMNIKELSIQAISEAVIKIRTSKLPNPEKIGNAGSFFKNPQIPLAQFEDLKKQYHQMVSYPATNNRVKVSAAWLIEQCGWKGKRVGNTGAHKDQPLVLVNYQNATGKEIKDLAMEIQATVKEKFEIKLIPEVNIV